MRKSWKIALGLIVSVLVLVSISLLGTKGFPGSQSPESAQKPILDESLYSAQRSPASPIPHSQIQADVPHGLQGRIIYVQENWLDLQVTELGQALVKIQSGLNANKVTIISLDSFSRVSGEGKATLSLAAPIESSLDFLNSLKTHGTILEEHFRELPKYPLSNGEVDTDSQLALYSLMHIQLMESGAARKIRKSSEAPGPFDGIWDKIQVRLADATVFLVTALLTLLPWIVVSWTLWRFFRWAWGGRRRTTEKLEDSPPGDLP